MTRCDHALRTGRAEKATAAPPGSPRPRAGFTLIELLVAMAILLAGIVTVAEMIPLAVRSNLRNRNDSTALITAQRLLEEMARHPLAAADTSCSPPGGHYNFCDADGDAIALGLQGTTLTDTGCPLDSSGQQLDFTVNCTADGYTVTKTEVWNPTTGTGQDVELRWHVFTLHSSAGTPLRKVFVIGGRAGVPGQGFVVTNLQTVVGR